MPEISVIVPVYRVEDKLDRCVDSLLQQTFSDFELLLTDDGSSDGSGNMCDSFAVSDSRVLVIHQSNHGVSTARNVGIKTVAGEYLAFVDSDDYVEPQYLEALQKGREGSPQLVICGVYFGNDQNDNRTPQENNGDLLLKFVPEESKTINQLIRDRRFNYVYAKLFQAGIIKKYHLSFDEDISLGEDTIFVMQYLQHIGSCCIVGAPYYTYVKNSNGSLTSRFYPDIYDKYTLINKCITETFSSKGISVSDAVDSRCLESALWAIDSIRFSSGLEKKEQTSLVGGILRSPELQNVLRSNNPMARQVPAFAIMKKGNAKKLLCYYHRTERRERFYTRIRIMTVAIFPSSWIRKVKKWLRISQ